MAKGIVRFEASMQYGGGGGFVFGPLTGEGLISVSIFMRLKVNILDKLCHITKSRRQESLAVVPPDLDLTPCEDEEDWALL